MPNKNPRNIRVVFYLTPSEVKLAKKFMALENSTLKFDRLNIYARYAFFLGNMRHAQLSQ